MLELSILILSAFANLFIGLVVLLKNPKGLTNRFFFLLTSALVVWSIVNYLSTNPLLLDQLTWIRLTLFCGGLLNLAVFINFIVFPSMNLTQSAIKKIKIALVSSLVILPLTLTPLVFKALDYTSGDPQPVPNPGIALFMVHTIGLIGFSIYTLFSKYRNAKGRQKSQFGLVLTGVVGTFSCIIVTNFLLVTLLNVTAFVTVGPAFTLIFSGAFAYAIIKHGLFDIRAAVARTVAYLLSLGMVGLIYGIFIFTVFSIYDTKQISVFYERGLFIGLAMVTALLFPGAKRYFDHLTTRLFYQDAYDTEEFLGKTNKLLVGQIELDSLLIGITNQIELNLKSSYCVFVIRETAYEDVRIVGTEKHHFNTENLKELRSLAPHAHRKMLITDELDEYTEELGGIMRSLDISVLIRLVSNTSYDVEGMGYLVIGPKKNGTIYSQQDKQVLEILSNEMVIAIENALRFEEIEKFNLTLQEKIDDATKKLRKTNEKLKALDETKDEFISMASHQLRTPLTSVKGYLSMVLEGDTGDVPEMQRKMLDQAFVSSQRMVYLIADLLNVSRLRTGKFIIEQVPTQLADVVADEVTQLQETAKARKLTLNYKKPEDFPVVPLDETKIRQVIMNFLDNAIYYTPAGGEINVELTDDGKVIEYKVIDNGIGISKWEQAHLFSKFFRAGNAKKARPDGTGLGLFMAKKVIVASGGSIIFKSAEGKGSTFGFAFEKAKLEKMAAEQAKKDEVTHPKPTDLVKK